MNNICYVLPNIYQVGFLPKPGPDFGIFRLRGQKDHNTVLERHLFVLTEVPFDGHQLLVNIHYGGRERLIIENTSDPASNAIFTLKHAGISKKVFKPGDIITPPETYTLTWIASNIDNQKFLVSLTLIPQFAINGLTVHYTVEPNK